MQRMLVGAVAAIAAYMVVGQANAQGSWAPTRHVEMIVGTDPGGAQDRMVRLLHQVIEKYKLIPTTASVVNKPGAAHANSIAYANSHRADPHYLMLVDNSWSNNAIINNDPKSLDEVTPILRVFDSKSLYFVRADSRLKTAKDVVDGLKADPGAVSFASSASPGSQNWLTIVTFGRAAGITDVRKLRIAINASGAETNTQVLGGHDDIGVGGIEGALPLMDAGQVRVLGLISDSRLPIPKVAAIPTMAEQGVPAVSNNWYAMVASKGISAEQTAYWEALFRKAMATDDVKTYATQALRGMDLVGSKEFKQFLVDEDRKQRTVMTELGLLK